MKESGSLPSANLIAVPAAVLPTVKGPLSANMPIGSILDSKDGNSLYSEIGGASCAVRCVSAVRFER